jgi:phosphonatase-like hydrolase
VSLVCFGLVGTVALERSLVDRTFAEAIATQGIVPGTEAYARAMVQVDRARGRPPIDVMNCLFIDDEARAQAANIAFERSFRAALDRFGVTVLPGASEAVRRLSAAGMKVCLMSGLSQGCMRLVLGKIGWGHRVDLVLCADDVPRGCPWPDFVLTAIIRLGIGDVREVAVAGDTENHVLCGRRAGARMVAGLLAGGHTAGRLRQAGATHLLDSIAGLPDLVASGTGVTTVPLKASRLPSGSVPSGSVPSQSTAQETAQASVQGRHAGL